MKTVLALNKFDWGILALLAFVGLWLGSLSINQPVHPAEDAAMLMRYSRNVADGHGIVWNVGQPPVDGATDFLFMLILAGLYTLGGNLESTVIWMGVVTHLLTVLLIYYGQRRYFTGSVLAGLVSTVFLLLGPGLRYAEASFGTPFFAFFLTLTWIIAQRVIEEPLSWNRAILFSLTALLTGLTRPEGVLAAVFILMAVVIRLGWRKSAGVVMVFLGIFLLLGGVYFLWRWQYFGHPLPNPFYKKGGGQLYFSSLEESWAGVLALSFPFWLAGAGGAVCLLWTGLYKRVFSTAWFEKISQFFSQAFDSKSRPLIITVLRLSGAAMLILFLAGIFRQSSNLHEFLIFGRYSVQYAGFLAALLVTGLIALSASVWLPEANMVEASEQMIPSEMPSMADAANTWLFVVIPVAGFATMWVLLSNEMNYLWRFQYPILPVILMSWPLLINALWKTTKIPFPIGWSQYSRGLLLTSMVITGFLLINSQADRWKINYQTDGRYDVAEFLLQYADKKYTIATTEAGLLPLFSGWMAVDTWGLNDVWIAQNGGITAEYLEQANPEIIMFHADFSPVAPRFEASDAWGEMTLTLEKYARSTGYILAAVYGANPVDTHYYYVHPDFPESREIVKFIQNLEGRYNFGPRTLDYNKLMWKDSDFDQ